MARNYGLIQEYPVMTVQVRQAGKPLVKAVLKGYTYSNLEEPDMRVGDRRSSRLSGPVSSPVILDEIQKCRLLSYIQAIVDGGEAWQSGYP